MMEGARGMCAAGETSNILQVLQAASNVQDLPTGARVDSASRRQQGLCYLVCGPRDTGVPHTRQAL
jgi:hypothetical protein